MDKYASGIKYKSRPHTYRNKLLKRILNNKDMYLLLVPGLVYLFIFKYIPMYGIAIAFQNFNIFAGIQGSEWVGIDNFVKLFSSNEFYKVFVNTLLISVYKIIFTFPIPIFIAIVLNEIRNMHFKKYIQTIIYMPHFLSWVIVSGLFVSILSPASGLVNAVIKATGHESIHFIMSPDWFRTVVVGSSAWKEAGWGAIVYLSAIAGIDQGIYEAARIDGAGRIRQIIHITLPGLSSTIVLMLILKLGHILDAGTEQILLLYNPVVYDVGDIIGTYVYRMGIGKMEYSFSTAVGMFNSVIGFMLIILGNWVSKKLVHKSIW